MRNTKKVLDLLRSGNFTLAYHEHDYCTIHKGKFKYDDLPKDEDDDLTDIVAQMGGEGEGYASEEVTVLVKALGGKVVSI